VPLYMLTVELNLKRILELGTRDGDSTVALLMPAKKIHGTVRSIDINPCENARKRVKAAGLDALWQFKMIDDRTFEPDSEIDHLFIDTSHSYEQTLSELKRFEPYVSRGGVISMHDAGSSPGVPRAVDDFVSSRGDLSLHILLNNNGLALIFKH
jgi:predicted O-methyltransferase YrrM